MFASTVEAIQFLFAVGIDDVEIVPFEQIVTISAGGLSRPKRVIVERPPGDPSLVFQVEDFAHSRFSIDRFIQPLVLWRRDCIQDGNELEFVVPSHQESSLFMRGFENVLISRSEFFQKALMGQNRDCNHVTEVERKAVKIVFA
jgi:hypothetical protein